jgi:hypothetical protein
MGITSQKIPEMVELQDNFTLGRYYRRIHQETQTQIQNKLWPCAEDFYHPWNPTFGFFFTSEAHMKLYDMILLRDGAQGVLDFFIRFSKHKTGFSKVAIHEDFAFLIPKGWRNKTVLYRIEKNKQNVKTNKFILFGLQSDAFLHWDQFQYCYDKWIKKTFTKESEINLYLPVREEPFATEQRDRCGGTQFICELQSYSRKKIKMVTLTELKLLTDNSDYTFVHLDLWKNVVSLCSIENFAFSKPCQIMPRKSFKVKRTSDVARKPLSLNHDLVITKDMDQQSQFEEISNFYKSHKNLESLPLSFLSQLMSAKLDP